MNCSEGQLQLAKYDKIVTRKYKNIGISEEKLHSFFALLVPCLMIRHSKRSMHALRSIPGNSLLMSLSTMLAVVLHGILLIQTSNYVLDRTKPEKRLI